MTLPTKPSSVQSYQLYLYKRALHPEFFTLKARKMIRGGGGANGYEAEAWLMPGAHLLRFQHGSFVACELVTFQDRLLPTEGAVMALPCSGEQDFEHMFGPERVRYSTMVQTETLSESLYGATYAELVELAGQTGATVHRYEDPELGRCLSMFELQRYQREVHLQSYHMIATSGFVLRTQSIFEHL